LKSPILPFGGQAGTQALVRNLQFDPELVDSYELGAKFSNGPFGLSVSAFRSDFSSFQLNTFNGTVFLVQNVNGCDNLVGGLNADTDQNLSAAGTNFNAAPNTTGSCAAGDITYGVRTQGLELEASLTPARNFRMAAGLTYAKTTYRDDLIGTKNGAPLDSALRKLPGDNLSNAPEFVATSSVTWTPDIGSNGMSGLVYIDGRMTSDYNTGSDLFPQKEQDGFAVFNARIGLRGPDEAWGIELWGQNIFNQDYAQVAFNSPFQAGQSSAPFVDPQYPGGRQIFSQFLAEPRTYGITLRGKF
jgi:outer membrane receptor protein involved in Fe transport